MKNDVDWLAAALSVAFLALIMMFVSAVIG